MERLKTLGHHKQSPKGDISAASGKSGALAVVRREEDKPLSACKARGYQRQQAQGLRDDGENKVDWSL
jgi:hypothetical protein